MSHVVSATVARLPPQRVANLNKRSLCEIWLRSLCSVSVPNSLKLQKPTGEPGQQPLWLHYHLLLSPLAVSYSEWNAEGLIRVTLCTPRNGLDSIALVGLGRRQARWWQKSSYLLGFGHNLKTLGWLNLCEVFFLCLHILPIPVLVLLKYTENIYNRAVLLRMAEVAEHDCNGQLFKNIYAGV